MAKQKSYAQMTRELTGLTPSQYKHEYTKFAARVRNYNAVAGTNYSASREFYYQFRYAGEPSPALKAIQATPATRARTAGGSALTGRALASVEAAARDVTLDRWGGFIRSSRESVEFGGGAAARIADELAAGNITPAQANEMFKNLAKEASARRTNDPAYRY